jgi:class 3 adenylate cyclase/tetratricopeptide (TPR) repeat protein
VCGEENPARAKFCLNCATPLQEPSGRRLEERKVVTVLFCDLVGFTARAERLDPEDVRAVLAPYHAGVRAELERHGGTVEKFIGDAVMAVFGAPIAHEDDPERAVRAALAIREFAVADGLELRIGITTGEALVSLDARPAEGEGIASGDVVNTAARLQSAAPVNGILVDETTARATRDAIEYDDAEPVQAKGKSQPIATRLAREARARFGVDVAHEARTELVGREREFAILRDALDRARHERTPQLVTLVGVPGMGKSRLVYELSRVVDADPDLITWRQGRSLAYGSGVTLWALGEIVKAQAGIGEQDTPDHVAAKVRSSVADALSGSKDEAWVESHLLALVGLAGEMGLGADPRGEAFAAWRRYLEALAEQRPLVLVFEDLHWADDSLLEFVDELVDWVSDVPLLVVGTARPELLERRPNWSGGKLNATTLAIAPLSDEQTARLLARLLESPVLDADAQHELLERAGGNPLYAEQFADLFVEQGSTEELPVPETLQGIIAARLDGLQQAEKELLRDAAVVGKVFWQSSLGDGASGAGETLHGLERKGFVRRQRRSSLEGESEFAFSHALVRDVAYGQIARVERAEKHHRVAEWIESLGRPDDHAEMVAHHWRSALELTQAAGREDPNLEERTRAALREAGDRAFALNSYPAAERYYEEAIGLSATNDAQLPALLFHRARALMLMTDGRRTGALLDARDALLGAGDHPGAAEAEAFLAQVSWYEGRSDEVFTHLAAAQRLVEGERGSSGTTRVLAMSARYRALAGENEAGLALARTALTMAEELGLDELRAHALITIGTAKFWLGEQEAAERHLQEAFEIALAADSPLAATALNNLGVIVSDTDLPRESEFIHESIAVAERMGDRETMRFAQANLIFDLYALGRWDESLVAADDFIAECEAGKTHRLEYFARTTRSAIRLGRGDIEAALADLERARELTRERSSAGPDQHERHEPIVQLARAYFLIGRDEEARALAGHLMRELRPTGRPIQQRLTVLSLYAEALGIASEMRDFLGSRVGDGLRKAASTALAGDFIASAAAFAAVGTPTAEAEARLRAAEQFWSEGRRTDAERELAAALEFFRSVGATLFVERAERLLDEPARSESA